MILRPNGPFCNIPPANETQVEFISKLIDAAEHRKAFTSERHDSFVGRQANAHAKDNVFVKQRSLVVEASSQAEVDWTALCDDLSKDSLFRKTDSWIFGGNLLGKKHAVMFYFGGLGPYSKIQREVVSKGLKGYTVTQIRG